MEIKPGKYKTRGGETAVVLCVDAPVTYNRIIGYVIVNGDDYDFAMPMHWESDGNCRITIPTEDDLIEFIEE